MQSHNPNKFPGFPSSALPDLRERFTRLGKKPKVGVSQGGSGRKNAGCKSAATQTPKP